MATSAGANRGSFGPVEWSLVAATSVVWGSSYLWIALGLESFSPGLVAWLRLVLGVGIVTLLPRASVRIERRDWSRIAAMAVAGNAAPAMLFALAEQSIESSVVGMMTAATPLVTLAIAAGLGNRTLRPVHLIGLSLGLIGVLAMTFDNVVGANAGATGITYVAFAVVGYALTSNLTGPLVEKYGAAPVIWRALILASLVMTPTGLWSLRASTFSWKSSIAVAILGICGTGIARSMYASLIRRVGAPRAAVVGYFVPGVAVILGVVVLHESMSWVESCGLAVVIIGALLGSRRIKASSGESTL